jgi:pimeloyl-ACP methyl ester carboxylesterase
MKVVDALGEDGKLRYWGRSYGTDLGQTIAAMFPDRIDRMFLDSVQRVSDYWPGFWQSATRDTEKAFAHFLSECITAGTEVCPGIANFTGANTTVDSIVTALDDIFTDLIDNPLYLPEDYLGLLPWWRPGGLPLLHEIKYRLFQFNYRPEQWPRLYTLVLSVLARDWEGFLAPFQVLPTNQTTPAEKPWHQGVNGLHGIGCSDASFRATKPEQLFPITQAQSAEGSWADTFSPQIWPCAQWKFEAAERFKGKFENINTSFPILMANSPFDPITPLSGAWEASTGFLNSRLLVHKGHGHGFMNHPSKCTTNAVSAYFNEGTLPEIGTECEPDKTGFEHVLDLLAAAGGNGTTTKRSVGNQSIRQAFELAKRTPVGTSADLGVWS